MVAPAAIQSQSPLHNLNDFIGIVMCSDQMRNISISLKLQMQMISLTLRVALQIQMHKHTLL